VLVDRAASPNLSVIAPMPPRYRRTGAGVGVVRAGHHPRPPGGRWVNARAALASQRLSIGLGGLARCYDFVVIDAGALPEVAPRSAPCPLGGADAEGDDRRPLRASNWQPPALPGRARGRPSQSPPAETTKARAA
jgi:hypothetical protein